jgi:hypothetical protein
VSDGDAGVHRATWHRSYALGFRFATVCAAIVVVLLLGALAAGIDDLAGWERWTHVVLLALAGFGSFVAWRWSRGVANWGALLAAFVSYSLAQAMLAFEVAPGLDADSLAPNDVFMVVWGLCIVVFLVRRLFDAGRVNALVHLLDAAFMTLSLTLVVWEQIISPSVGDASQLSLVHQVVIVAVPMIDLFIASILLLLLLVARSPGRVAWFVAALCMLVGDVAASSTGNATTAASLAVSAPFWVLGMTGFIVAAGLPAGARVAARRA